MPHCHDQPRRFSNIFFWSFAIQNIIKLRQLRQLTTLQSSFFADLQRRNSGGRNGLVPQLEKIENKFCSKSSENGAATRPKTKNQTAAPMLDKDTKQQVLAPFRKIAENKLAL